MVFGGGVGHQDVASHPARASRAFYIMLRHNEAAVYVIFEILEGLGGSGESGA